VWPLLDTAPAVEAVGIAMGLLTAVYGTLVSRVQSDAKGALAHATLAQTGLILAEIAAGWTTIALVHLVGHASLRVWQYLRAPNTLHDAHQRGHGSHGPARWERLLPASTRVWLYGAALHRFRLDDRLDAVADAVRAGAHARDRLDRAFRARTSLDARAGPRPSIVDDDGGRR
jgi:NAD(P)H-quinone oxidoreductase subunit 5